MDPEDLSPEWHDVAARDQLDPDFPLGVQVNGQNVGGFSSARYYGTHTTTGDTVPDSGSSLILLGAALVGVGAISRKLKA